MKSKLLKQLRAEACNKYRVYKNIVGIYELRSYLTNNTYKVRAAFRDLHEAIIACQNLRIVYLIEYVKKNKEKKGKEEIAKRVF